MTVPKKAHAIIEAMLAFANLPRIDSDDQVQALFSKLPFKWAKHHRWLNGEKGRPWSLIRDRHGNISPFFLQEEIRRWLERIVRGDQLSIRHAASNVDDALRYTAPMQLGIDLESLRLTTTLHVGIGLTADDVCVLGVAYLFEWRLLHRLRQCQLKDCGRFRVTFKGKPWTYCSTAHQQEGEQSKAKKRARDWRIDKARRQWAQRRDR